jgi:hypothetical protein
VAGQAVSDSRCGFRTTGGAQVKLDALTAERDALLRAQTALADENTRLAIEVSSLKARPSRWKA